ncbi:MULTISPECIES: fructosamine kinase family protein [Methylomonas]|uniref:fructosamine kinase family protein n=1 Tax=Methylomonas TaxID=416 RepID=UPI00123194F3|nr:fructosamine kinase family protein [Methylomonas rhizoryzae]
MPLSPALVKHISEETGRNLAKHKITSVGGGDINAAYRLQAENTDWFIKFNRVDLLSMFVAEAAGLAELAESGAVQVPSVVAHGEFGTQAYLILEFIELDALRSGAGKLGEQLARLHGLPQMFFGWHMHNTIGSTPQFNARDDDWVGFWRKQRLGRQLQFAASNGCPKQLLDSGEKLMQNCAALFSGYRPQPSLLHGDLWGGNAARDQQGNPVIFDPACYYGDREADIAMTELFGGFGADFYAAYQGGFPLDAGYKVRKTLYNLYHILNHFNLFGGGYAGQAHRMMEQLLAEIG